jgi:hypothetical protein
VVVRTARQCVSFVDIAWLVGQGEVVVSESREVAGYTTADAVRCYVTAGTFTRLGLCRLPYDKALVSRVLSISHDE